MKERELRQLIVGIISTYIHGDDLSKISKEDMINLSMAGYEIIKTIKKYPLENDEQVNETNAEDFQEVEWSDFVNAHGMAESMDELFKHTGYTLKIEYGLKGIERIYPCKLNK